jgi:lipopolysaccharide/colanic/teichoic acid biosynthesis glycosyltransferase
MIRLFDFFLSLAGILVMLPIFFFLFVINLSNGGSAIFAQNRIGAGQKPFVLYKFRTMPFNTRSVATHLVKNIKVSLFHNSLRKSKLDEIPQLWNVLLGDMSLVGPRPCLLNQRKLISERRKRKVFSVKPGITGLAQIKGITMQTPTLLAKTDVQMIKKMNLYYYFYYIFMTLFIFLKRK